MYDDTGLFVLQRFFGQIRLSLRQLRQEAGARVPAQHRVVVVGGADGLGALEEPHRFAQPFRSRGRGGVAVAVHHRTGAALGQVFSGKRSVRDTFSGPIGIAAATKRATEVGGIEAVFRMLGFLSLNLGIFNLLPIPVLDGGMIFMLFVEGGLGLVGKKLSMTARERIQQVGFVFLLLLIGFVIINDVTKFAPGWFRSEKPTQTQQK